MVIRADLDWQTGAMDLDEQPVDWLDRVHPVEYGVVLGAGVRDGRYLWGVGLATAAGPVERFRRCPTCEEWSPCTVRQALLPLMRAGRDA